uniref:(northern house mosquito) hypothetical protein n=1 Tax=Culex pipiens TaxID=7175 RepID=A0A8D8L1R7_CULPI
MFAQNHRKCMNPNPSKDPWSPSNHPPKPKRTSSTSATSAKVGSWRPCPCACTKQATVTKRTRKRRPSRAASVGASFPTSKPSATTRRSTSTTGTTARHVALGTTRRVAFAITCPRMRTATRASRSARLPTGSAKRTASGGDVTCVGKSTATGSQWWSTEVCTTSRTGANGAGRCLRRSAGGGSIRR